MPLIVLAALMAALSIWLLVPSRTHGSSRPSTRRLTRIDRAAYSVLPAVLVGGAASVVAGTTLALTVILAISTIGVTRLILTGRARRQAELRADQVVEVCEALAAELRAGQPPLAALKHCVEVWPALEDVVTAADLGSDVPEALRRLARAPGAGGLRDLASAWQVSEATGGTLSRAVALVAETERRRRSARQLVASELASAHATARLVALLPVAVLGMGSGLGGDPWTFLLRTPWGLGLLATGLGLTYLGLAWIDRIARDGERS